MSFPVRGGTVFGPATPHPSTAGVPVYTENMWSAPIAMLSMTRWRWKLLPHRAGVFRVAFPYWVMSRRLKFPVSGSSQVAMRWPLGPSFRHARPAVKPEKSANGTIDPNPAPTTRAVAEADVEVVSTPITFPKVVGKVCCGMCTRTRVNDVSKEMHGVSEATTARRFTSVQVGQGNAPSG